MSIRSTLIVSSNFALSLLATERWTQPDGGTRRACSAGTAAVVLKRGFPSTHYFAQARIVFEVARSRCRDLFDPPDCMTLWSLPAEIEERFQEHWHDWLDEIEPWKPVFQRVEKQGGGDLLQSLRELDLISQPQLEAVARLRRTAENRAVPITGTFRPHDDIITLLASWVLARGTRQSCHSLRQASGVNALRVPL